MTIESVKYKIKFRVDRAKGEEPEIVFISAFKNDKPMEQRNGVDDKPCFAQEGPFRKGLEDGCVGLGVAYDNRCRWRWAWWL